MSLTTWMFRRKTAPYRFEALAQYNGERARGILHSEEWVKRMSEEQRTFDWFHGITKVPGGPRDSEKPPRPPDNP